MKLKASHFIGPALALGLFLLALRVLYRELANTHYHDIVSYFSSLSWSNLSLAFICTIASYLILTLYDVIAMRYAGQDLPYHKIAMASFIGYTLSHNLGFPLFTGGAARYRLFSAWGLSNFQIAQAIAFSGVVFWIGFVALAGAVFIISPPPLPPSIDFPYASLRPIGFICAFLVFAYFYFFSYKKRPVKVRDLQFPTPSTRLSLAGIIIAGIDWIMANNVAYFLLPETDLSYIEFLGLFQLGQIIGLLSHVPGGIGVFEATILAFLSDKVPPSAVIGSLLAYRVVYYLVPLACSLLMMLVHESLHYKETVMGFAGGAVRRVSAVLPYLVTISMVACGAILLFSGATPPVEDRFSWLAKILPLDVIESSHFIGSLVGIGLIILAHGLQRKLDAAYVLSVILLSIGIATSLLKGFDYEEAIILSVMLLFLLASRKHFYRRASLLGQAFEPTWIMAVAFVLVATIWLVFFAYKHVEYSNQLWWEFSFVGHAPRSLRATIGALGVAALWGAARLLRPTRPDFEPASPEELALAERVIKKFPHTYANLALLGDKSFIFNDNHTAFVMFSIEGKSCIALGDPVGDRDEQAELVWRFREFCDRHDMYCVFYQVNHETLPFYIDAGLSLVKLGEEALVPLQNFSLQGRAWAAMRSNKNKFERENYKFEVLSREQVPSIMPELKRISNTWLSEKNTREKGFSLGFFSPEYIGYFPVAIVRKEGQIVAFANIWTAAEKKELSVDLMRHLAEARPGIMDYLFCELMLWGKEEGFEHFSLGMAPLSGLEDRECAPGWNKIGNMVFRYSEQFYNFQGVQYYKEKFMPIWQPRYIASPGGLSLPRILTNVASLISGGFKGIFVK